MYVILVKGEYRQSSTHFLQKVAASHGGSAGKECACNAGDPGSTLGLGRFPGLGDGNSLRYSCLENPCGQRSLVGYSPRGQQRVGHNRETKHSTVLLVTRRKHVTKTCPWAGTRIRLINWPAPENIYLKPCSASFPRAQSASFLSSSLNSFQRALKVSSCRSNWFNNLSRGGWQVPICSWQEWTLRTLAPPPLTPVKVETQVLLFSLSLFLPRTLPSGPTILRNFQVL